ncbi:FAD-binding oxidoreductase [Tianweitania sp.]|uniref:FAD-binding oxidoreductase n=1 Tax=Tianweitania sp. TaxID=2021634 RepID=UPI00289F7073|nr:FAD-binding oxidoreductase [Tianweitania sp.]
MDDRARQFIAHSTLLFIASRNAAGAMDVSPRGGQPNVVSLREDGAILLPDYLGNRRLDTIGNVLANPDVALLFLNRRCNDYLRVAARAEILQAPDDLALFPADENPPLSVMVLTPTSWKWVHSDVFGDAGFWIDPALRKPPLDLGGVYGQEGQWQAAGGRVFVRRDAAGETELERSGIREHYGTPSTLVQQKVYRAAGPGFMPFIDQAPFIVLAREDHNGAITVELAGGRPLRRDPATNQDAFLLEIRPAEAGDAAWTHSGECALLAAEPGRCENIRLNGTYRAVAGDAETTPQISVLPEEIYFHCSAAFSRSRIWTDARPSAWTGLRAFRCVGRKQENADVVSFLFEPEDQAPVGPIAPGQYVTLALPGDDVQPPRRRCYSVSATPTPRTLRLSVRRIGAGGVSDLLHHTIQPSSEVLLGAPGGQFILNSQAARPVVLVGAGVGITPLLPMAQALAAAPDGREVWFVHAARSSKHHLFADEVVRVVEQAGESFKLFTVYSQPDDGDAFHHHGRLDAATLATLVPVTEADFYICGPDAFMDALRDGLVELGADPANIRMEAFEAKAIGLAGLLASQQSAVTPCQVQFARSGKTATWDPHKGSLLDLALAEDVEIQYSCRSGECQSCVQKIVSGITDYPAGNEPLLAYGQVLLCQAVPRGDLVLDC